MSYPAGRRPAQRFCAHCNDLLLRDEKWLCTTCYEIENNRPVAPPPPVNQERVLNLLRSYRLLCMSCGADMWVSLTRQRAQLLAKAGFKPCKMCRGALELIEDLHSVGGQRLRPTSPDERTSAWTTL